MSWRHRENHVLDARGPIPSMGWATNERSLAFLYDSGNKLNVSYACVVLPPNGLMVTAKTLLL